MSKVAKRILYLILVLVIIGIILYPKIDFSSAEEKAAAAAIASQPEELMTVDVVEIAFEPLDYAVRVTGSIIADESVALNAEISAKIDEIHFKEGMKVNKGQLLVSLNDDELTAELAKLQFNKKLYEDAEYRQRRLLESEAISREEYEVALTTLNTALADIRLIETRKSKYRLLAPFNGTIGLRAVSVGGYITPGVDIASIYRIDPVKLDFQIPGRYLKDVNVGDQLFFTVDGYDEQFEGAIYAIEPQIDPRTRSVKLRARSANPERKLLPGQFVKINLILDKIQQAIMVPTVAVIPELNKVKVFVYEDGIVASREVELGIRTESQVQIVSGLKPGDIVITSGLLQIRNGSEIKINR